MEQDKLMEHIIEEVLAMEDDMESVGHIKIEPSCPVCSELASFQDTLEVSPNGDNIFELQFEEVEDRRNFYFNKTQLDEEVLGVIEVQKLDVNSLNKNSVELKVEYVKNGRGKIESLNEDANNQKDNSEICCRSSEPTEKKSILSEADSFVTPLKSKSDEEQWNVLSGISLSQICGGDIPIEVLLTTLPEGMINKPLNGNFGVDDIFRPEYFQNEDEQFGHDDTETEMVSSLDDSAGVNNLENEITGEITPTENAPELLHFSLQSVDIFSFETSTTEGTSVKSEKPGKKRKKSGQRSERKLLRFRKAKHLRF